MNSGMFDQGGTASSNVVIVVVLLGRWILTIIHTGTFDYGGTACRNVLIVIVIISVAWWIPLGSGINRREATEDGLWSHGFILCRRCTSRIVPIRIVMITRGMFFRGGLE